MTVAEFSKATGWSEETIRRDIRKKEIAVTDKTKGTIRLTYDIDESLVPIFKKKYEDRKRKNIDEIKELERRAKISKTMFEKSIGRHKLEKVVRKGNNLTDDVNKLKKYNDENGTNYSYGEAVARGII